ncbi:MAG: tetratricopeptide repeat protein, partial [Halioglobus sp.]
SEFKRILDANPDNVIALNNVAWLLRDSEPRQALAYIERARDLSPNSPEILDTLAVIQYANKDYTQANTSIREALLRKPDDLSLQYHKAMVAAALGNTAEAIKELEAVLGSGADFPEQDDARRLLAQLQ